MVISEVIKKLQGIQQAHGDVEVYYKGDYFHGHLDDDLFDELYYFKNGMLYIE